MDLILFEQIKEKNRKAFKQLFEKYYSPLCEYASQFIADEEAEELVQDLMLFIWEGSREIIITQSLKSYLFTAVRYRCFNAIKREQYQARVHSELYEKLKEQFEDPDYYLTAELSKHIKKAIEALPPNYKETFVLSRFGDRTNHQIAVQQRISVKTVEYRISQALKILRVKLKDYLTILAF